jgi:hypothetical protein
MSKFEELRKIDVHKLGLVEKKGKLDYISWAGAWDLLAKADPDATYTYDEARVLNNETVMVSTTVSALGKVQSMIMPVINYSNKAIVNPDSMAVNTAYQRCLAKNIAVISGIGLSLYLGEVGVNEEVKEKPKKLSEEAIQHHITEMKKLDDKSKKEYWMKLVPSARDQIREYTDEFASK